MTKIFFCSFQLVLLSVVISVVAYFMWKSTEGRDPMLALALNGLYLWAILLYLIVMSALIGRWCI
jgi:hypothetical protein